MHTCKEGCFQTSERTLPSATMLQNDFTDNAWKSGLGPCRILQSQTGLISC